MKQKTKHKHHKVPKHMGGTDNPSNLIRLTVKEHAKSHKKLYEKYGKEEDKIAWLGLLGEISNKEAVLFGRKLGRKNANKKGAQEKAMEKLKWLRQNDPEWSESHSKNLSKSIQKFYINGGKGSFKGKTHTIETKKKMSQSHKDKHIGRKNSQYGTMWIYNLELKTNKKINSNEDIPEGWIRGRKMSF